MPPNTNLIALDHTNHDHLQLMFSVRTHPEVDRFLRGSPPASFGDHVNYVKNLRSHKQFYLVQSEATLCGYCQSNKTSTHIEIGMAIHPDYCNKGIGAAALGQFLIRLLQSTTNAVLPIILYVKTDNPRAIALYKKFGFETIGSENQYGEFLMQKL